MIEVIKKGSIKKVECGDCGSLLRYDEKEDVQTTQQKHELGTFTKEFIICPNCGSELVLGAMTR